MNKSIMEKIALKYRNLSSRIERKYHQACEFIGLADSTETRVFFGICVGVALFYTCYIMDRMIGLITEASATFLAIIHQ